MSSNLDLNEVERTLRRAAAEKAVQDADRYLLVRVGKG